MIKLFPKMQKSSQGIRPTSSWLVPLLVGAAIALALPRAAASLGASTTNGLAANGTQAGNFSTISVSSADSALTMAVSNQSTGNKTASNFENPSKPTQTHTSGIQARAASSYAASRAATGLQLKQKPNSKSTTSGSSAMGDPVGLETALESQMDLQTAAGEHKKYILVKKKPKHKKIKMEVFKPKMKYKKIKMKVPVKKMKKKKVKGYLVKKEKHHY